MADPVDSVESVRARRPAPGAADTSTPSPLGVPRDYRVRVEMPRFMGVQAPALYAAPRYHEGDEWKPARLPPVKIAQLQDTLANLGLLTEYRRGYWDPNSQKAYSAVLEYANANGTDEATAMRKIMEAGGLGGEVDVDGGERRQPLTVRRSNPLDIRKGADDVAQSVLGRKLRDDELPKIISAIQGLETSAQTQQYDMAGAAGGTITEPPSIEAFVESKLRADNPAEAAEMDTSEQLNNFLDVLGMGD